MNALLVTERGALQGTIKKKKTAHPNIGLKLFEVRVLELLEL